METDKKLRSAEFANFTVVPDDKWEFSTGLNVIIGENGLGKSHVLKSLYSTIKVLSGTADKTGVSKPTKQDLERDIAAELIGSMRPDALGRLVKRRRGSGQAKISVSFGGDQYNTDFQFSTRMKNSVDVTLLPQEYIGESPVFFPTRELITLCPWFAPLYDSYSIPFEKTWRDTVSLLGAPAMRGPRAEATARYLKPIETAMKGRATVDENGRFYLVNDQGKVEAPLVAEGLRKFVMLARLISTGVLFEQGYLFWDEPETNLNPKLIRVLATVIAHLAANGLQIFMATHSLFLLREIQMAWAKNAAELGDVTARSVEQQPMYFALASTTDGSAPLLEQGRSIDELKTIIILDEELDQADRYFSMENII